MKQPIGSFELEQDLSAAVRFQGNAQKPIAADLHVGRELWSFANALALLLMGAPSARELPLRLGRRPALRSPGQLRSDVVDIGIGVFAAVIHWPAPCST